MESNYVQIATLVLLLNTDCLQRNFEVCNVHLSDIVIKNFPIVTFYKFCPIEGVFLETITF